MEIGIAERSAEELLAAWRQAERELERIRLDAPDRIEAEDRVHDARVAYQRRVAELEAEESHSGV